MLDTMIDNPPDTTSAPPLKIESSRHFSSWMREQHVSLGFTTYQAGKLFLIGRQDDDRLSVFERTFNRCMGLWGNAQTLWMSSVYQLWRFENVLENSSTSPSAFDRLYVPQVGYTTGDVDLHDVAIESSGRAIFVNTLFSCLSTISETHSFVPLWKPPFVTRLAAEDRCHLNGLALQNGRATYVTAVAQSDTADGWRDGRRDGGCVIDVPTNNLVATGLSMPHSPRVYDNKLWLLNSGTGHFGYIELHTGKFQSIAFCAGYLRGLAFINNYAVIGLSKPRESRTFSGLALDENLRSAKVTAQCGLNVIDLRTGDIVHWLRLEGLVNELYDVIALPGVTRPQVVGFKTNEIHRVIRVADFGTM